MKRNEQEKKKVLIADDEPNILKLLSYHVEQFGYKALMARDGDECIRELKSERVSALLLDMNMPKKTGIEVLALVMELYPELPVIIVTAQKEIEVAVKAIKMGAYDYLAKPIDMEHLAVVLKNAVSKNNLEEKVADLENKLLHKELFTGLVGESEVLKDVFGHVLKVGQTEASVLIIGESGTGKEMIAQAIHRSSRRKDMPFIPVNCAAISDDIADSLLFGHKKGAFTGAAEDRVGLFEQANGGTIFLDEIGDMNIENQAKVLRVLESKMVRPVGEDKEVEVDFRLISATNQDFSRAIAANVFREDLYYRIEEYPIYLPPLRKRKEDIAALSQHFLNEFSRANNIVTKTFSKYALQKLINHNWPGNIRELKNVVRRVAIRTTGSIIENVAFSRIEQQTPIQDLPDTPTPVRVVNENEIVPFDVMEQEALTKAYNFCEGNAVEAAKILGISRATFYRKLKKIGIET